MQHQILCQCTSIARMYPRSGCLFYIILKSRSCFQRHWVCIKIQKWKHKAHMTLTEANMHFMESKKDSSSIKQYSMIFISQNNSDYKVAYCLYVLKKHKYWKIKGEKIHTLTWFEVLVDDRIWRVEGFSFFFEGHFLT